MRYLQNYNDYQKIDEGLKNWVATFLLLANMGLAPAHIVAGTPEEKKEFVDDMKGTDRYEGALFVDYLNKLGNVTDLESVWFKFKQENNLESDYKEIEKYVNKDGKVYRFDKKYITHDYTNVDINNFIPTNWMTDMGDFIEDSREPEINNWISDYEKLTSVEIGVVTVDNLDGTDVDEYANEQFRRLGVGKAKANNGILLVFSKQDRKWRIEVGYGLEGLLTDMRSGQIGRNIIVPHFKEGDYIGGIMGALEAIKEDLGTEAIESKKKWLDEKQAKEKAEMAESFQSFLDVVMGILVIGLLGYLVYYLTNRARLKREEREKLMRRINSLMSQIDDIKSKFPTQPKLSGSNQLSDIHSLVKKVIEESKIQPVNQKMDDETRKNLEIVLGKLNSSTDAYYSTERRVGDALSNILSLGATLLITKSMLDKSATAAKEIEQLGYSATPIDPSLLNNLEQSINKIQSVAKTDIDSAIAAYSRVKSEADTLQGRSGKVIGTLSDIRSAMSRVNNWESEIERKYKEFKDLASKEEIQEAKEAIQELKDKVKSSKDYLKLESDIDKVLVILQRPIERESRRKREEEEKKRREREEEERRRRRKCEEEEDRRRRNSYSSSSSSSYDFGSSSSSFGGFGGGDSGGGGASGSW